MTFEASLGQILTAAASQQHEFLTDRSEEPPHARPTIKQEQPGHPPFGPNLFTSALVMCVVLAVEVRISASMATVPSSRFRLIPNRAELVPSVLVTDPMKPCKSSQPAVDHRKVPGILLAPLPLKMPSAVMTNRAPVRP